MSKGISVKVARVKVIEALMSKLDDMEYEKVQYDAALKQYEADKIEYRNALAQIAIAHMNLAENLGNNTGYRTHWFDSNKTHIEVSVAVPNDELPEEPKHPDNPFQSHGYGRNYVGGFDDRKADILNAIRILQLSDEDTVNTATYASVAKYL